jgi:hypothetical protein
MVSKNLLSKEYFRSIGFYVEVFLFYIVNTLLIKAVLWGNVIKLSPNHTKKLSSFLKGGVVVYMSWTLKYPPCDKLHQDAGASVNRRGLHNCELVDLGSGGRFAKDERPAAEVVTVLGLNFF